jgi:hypothetical protein
MKLGAGVELLEITMGAVMVAICEKVKEIVEYQNLYAEAVLRALLLLLNLKGLGV